jgi:hypothetical protein
MSAIAKIVIVDEGAPEFTGEVVTFKVAYEVSGGVGNDGEDGDTPFINASGNWQIGATDTGVKAAGTDGQDGTDGTDGDTPYINASGNWQIGATDTGVKASGTAGQDGTDGQSAFEVAVANGFVGTEAEWLDSLQGQRGSGIFLVWAEDNGNAPDTAINSGYQWSFGNGDDTPTDHGIVIPIACTLEAITLDIETPTGTHSVAVEKNGVNTGASITSTTDKAAVDVSPIAFAPGDVLTFRTTAGAAGGESCRVTAMLRPVPVGNPGNYDVQSNIAGVTGASSISNIVSISQADFDAIATPDPSTLYLIIN